MSSEAAVAALRLGNFELMTRIAKGGMAEIFLARQTNVPGFERLVVVKKILPQLAEEPAFVRMFLEEARLAALINHPNVVQIHDVGVHDGQYFIAMEHISGVTVSALVRAAVREGGHGVSAAGALELTAQACAGLDAAHCLHDVAGSALGVVHRDVTPQNLMVTRAGLVKVLDFGIAKATARTRGTEVGTLKGKYPYMSPEQVRAEPLDARSDLFSLGAVLYELVTGKSPFERPSELEVLNAVNECRVPPPSRVAPLPPEVDRFVLRALAREPADRFQSAAEMERAACELLDALGHRSSPELLRTEVVARFDALFTAQQTVVEDAVSSVRTRVRTIDGAEKATRVDRQEAIVSRPGGGRRGVVAVVAVAVGALIALAAVASGVPWWAGHFGGPGGRAASPPAALPAPTASPMPAVLTGPPLRLGTPPFIPADLLRAEIAPLVEHLSRRLGRPVTLTIGRGYDDIAAQIVAGELDVAKLTPLQYVRARAAAPGIQLLAIQTYDGSSSYEGYLVTLDEHSIESVEDLRGRRPCWVEPGSASGYLLPRTFLRRQGLDPDRDLLPGVSSGDHVAVLRDLLAGKCEVGAIASGTLLAARDLSIPVGRVRVLAATGRLPLDAFVASPRLPAAEALRVQAALVGLSPARDLGMPFIGRTLRIGGFAPGEDRQFDPLRAAAAADTRP